MRELLLMDCCDEGAAEDDEAVAAAAASALALGGESELSVGGVERSAEGTHADSGMVECCWQREKDHTEARQSLPVSPRLPHTQCASGSRSHR